ncbi:hypothetical protein pEaSNUABM42_00279 [Erwinia phage pEa_SNUABM_42]|nr:hypothetical protein pEaSNUABM43_00280 [Erwinia phage pEa_SNUABM_43]QVW55596.1 hypothetical protein pEaSNUABM42_00279 [Erwinia phage pEa_SNUABM_42]
MYGYRPQAEFEIWSHPRESSQQTDGKFVDDVSGDGPKAVSLPWGYHGTGLVGGDHRVSDQNLKRVGKC